MPKLTTLFDTTQDAIRPDLMAEAVLFGDDMSAILQVYDNGQRYISLGGPDGSIELPEHQWANIFAAMGLAPAGMKLVA